MGELVRGPDTDHARESSAVNAMTSAIVIRSAAIHELFAKVRSKKQARGPPSQD
jgi:hypothetical protein